MRIKSMIIALALLAGASHVVGTAELRPDLTILEFSISGTDYGVEQPFGTTPQAVMTILNNGQADAPASHVRACTMNHVVMEFHRADPVHGEGWCGTWSIQTIPSGAMLYRIRLPMPDNPCGEEPQESDCFPHGMVPGRHKACAFVDMRKEIDESDESNNTYCTITLRAQVSQVIYYLEGSG